MVQVNRAMTLLLALALWVGVVDETQGAKITSAQRQLRVFAGDAFDDQTITLDHTSLGLFDDSRTISFFSEDDGDGGGGGGDADASQTSTVTLDTVIGVGAGTALGGGGTGTGSAGGRSLIDITFTIDQLTEFVLDGSVTVTGSLFSRSEVVLTRTAPDMVEIFRAKRGEEADEGTTDFSGPNQITGVLDPGSYSFLALAWAISNDFDNANASFDVALTIPEPHTAAWIACGLIGVVGVKRGGRA